MKRVHVHVSTLKFSCVINFFDKLKILTALPIHSCTLTLVVAVVKHTSTILLYANYIAKYT